MTLSHTHRNTQETDSPLGGWDFQSWPKESGAQLPPSEVGVPFTQLHAYMTHRHPQLMSSSLTQLQYLFLSYTDTLKSTNFLKLILLVPECLQHRLSCSMSSSTSSVAVCAAPLQSSFHIFQLCFCTYCPLSSRSPSPCTAEGP